MRTIAINKRPVNPFATVLAILLGLALHLLQPFAALGQGIKRASAQGRISHSSNRIHALKIRLANIDAAVQEERANGNRTAEIQRLAKMKAAACAEIADEEVVLFAAKQALRS